MKKRMVAGLLALAMILSVLPAGLFGFGSMAADASPAASDLVKYGQYNSEGEWVENNNNGTLSYDDGNVVLSKTATPTTTLNKYDIDLTVKIRQQAAYMEPNSIATVLVLDVSNSMSTNTDMVKGTGSNCNGSYTTYYTRMEAAQLACSNFLDEMAKVYKDYESKCYVAVVAFSDTATVACNWQDLSSETGRAALEKAVSDLEPDSGTNLDAGLGKAAELLQDARLTNLLYEAKNTVVLTDGAPTYYVDTKGKIQGSGSSTTKTLCEDTILAAKALQKLGSVYTVAYNADTATCYTTGSGSSQKKVTVGEFLSQIAGTTSNAAEMKNVKLTYSVSTVNDLIKAFVDIAKAQLTSAGWKVNDSAPDKDAAGTTVSVVKLEPELDTKTWSLSKPDEYSEDTSEKGYITYIYKFKYTATLNEETLVNGTYYPTNGKTELKRGSTGKTYDFPIPAVKGISPQHTVTFLAGDYGTLNGDKASVQLNKTHNENLAGTEIPAVTADDTHYFIGWNPTVQLGAVTADATYTAQYGEKKTVTLTAPDVQKVYNGTEQTVTISDLANYYTGLPTGYTLSGVTYSASATYVSDGKVIGEFDYTDAVIMNGSADVTSEWKFKVSETAPGSITITPAPLTLAGGLNEFKYNSGETRYPDADKITVTSGLIDGDTFESADFVKPMTGVTAVGDHEFAVDTDSAVIKQGQKDVSDCYTVTAAPAIVRITYETGISVSLDIANGVLQKVYDNVPIGKTELDELLKVDTTGFVVTAKYYVGDIEITDANPLVNVGNYTITVVVTSIKATGTDTELLGTTYILGSNLSVSGAQVIITPVVVSYTVNDANKMYDGTPLTYTFGTTADTVVGTLPTGFSFKVEGSASILYPNGVGGSTGNLELGQVLTIKIMQDQNEAEKLQSGAYRNFTLATNYGTYAIFAINNLKVSVTADSDTKTYDGTALTKNSYTPSVVYDQDGTPVAQLATGDEFSVEITGSQTDAGSSNNVVTTAKILHRISPTETVDVTAAYPTITKVNGTLTVNKKTVYIRSTGIEKEFDGVKFVSQPEISATNTEAGYHTYVTGDGVLGTGDTFTVLEATGSARFAPSNVATDVNWQVKNGSSVDVTNTNYSWIKRTDPIVIKQASDESDELYFGTCSDDKFYDGTPLTYENEDGYTVDFEDLTDELEDGKWWYKDTNGKFIWYMTDAVYQLLKVNAKEGGYEVPAITVTLSGSITAVGTVKNSIVTITFADFELPEDEVSEGSGALLYASYGWNDSVPGTLTVKANTTEEAVKLTAGSDSKEYDNTALNNDTWTSDPNKGAYDKTGVKVITMAVKDGKVSTTARLGSTEITGYATTAIKGVKIDDMHVIVAQVSGSQQSVGNSANTISGYKIYLVDTKVIRNVLTDAGLFHDSQLTEEEIEAKLAGYALDVTAFFNAKFAKKVDGKLDVTANPVVEIKTDNGVALVVKQKGSSYTAMGADEVHSGDILTYTVTLKNGYTLKSWAVDGTVNALATGLTYQYTVPTSGKHTIYVTTQTIDYNINYVLDGGENNKENPAKYTVEQEITLKNPTKPGYKFEGWYLNNEKVTKIEKGSTGDKTFTAKWTAIKYKIVFDANNGVLDQGDADSINAEFDKTYYASGVSRKGYNFLGWTYNSNNYNVKAALKNLTEVDGATVTLVASWSDAIKYDIEYVMNGGTNDPTNPSKYTVEDEITLKNPTKPGYTFAGWYINGKNVTKIEKGTTGKLTITANWTAIKYTIDYDYAGGNETDNPGTYTIETATFALKNPTRVGFEFKGWILEKVNGVMMAGNSAQMTYNVTKGTTGNLSFRATWEAKNQLVKLTNQKGIKESDATNWNPKTDETITLTAVVKPGYEFAGWVDQKTGKLVSNELEIQVKIPDGGIDYLVCAKALGYKITYDLKGGAMKAGEVNPATYTAEDTFTLYNPVKAGYTFVGWVRVFDVQEGMVGAVQAKLNCVVELGTTGDLKFQAVWKPDSQPVEKEKDKGVDEIETNNPDPKTDEYVTLTAKVKKGYHFDGWYDLNNNEKKIGDQLSITLKVPVGGLNVEARSIPNAYTLHFIGGDGATGEMADQTMVYDTQAAVLKNGFTKIGFTFVGWKGEEAKSVLSAVLAAGQQTVVEGLDTEKLYADGEVVLNLTDEDGAVINMTAQWKANSYTVKFDVNGGAAVADIQATYGQSFKLPETTKTGFTFTGWKLGDKIYKAGEEVADLATADGAVVTFVAVWEEIPATGYNDNTMLWASGLVLSTAAAAVAFTLKRKKEDEE